MSAHEERDDVGLESAQGAESEQRRERSASVACLELYLFRREKMIRRAM